MVNAADYPYEDSHTVKWFNQMMEEQQARYCFYAARALEETPDCHLIWNCDATD